MNVLIQYSYITNTYLIRSVEGQKKLYTLIPNISSAKKIAKENKYTVTRIDRKEV